MALFSMYTRIVEEEDSRMTERWEKEADGVLIFVSPRVDIRKTTPINPNYRLVYSRLPSQR